MDKEEVFTETKVRIPAYKEGESVLSAMVSVPKMADKCKKAVVLVHGMFGSGTAPGVVPTLAEALRSHYVVCRLDLTGNGDSEGT